MNAIPALGASLHAAGVRRIVCPPGTDPLGQLAHPAIERIVCGDVQLGVCIADGAARASGGREIVPLALESPLDVARGIEAVGPGTPMLVISMAREACSDMLRGAGPSTHRGLMGAADVVPSVSRAMEVLGGDAPGPVVLELNPQRPSALAPTGVASASRTRLSGSDVRRAARRMLAARRPLILAGSQMRHAAAYAVLAELAEWAAIPVATTPLGRGAFPETHPLALGSVGPGASLPVRAALREADLIVGVGLGLSRAERESVAGLGRRRPILVLASVPSTHPPGITDALIGNPVHALEDLLACARNLAGFAPRPTRGVPERIAARRARWLAAWRAELMSEAHPINPHRVMAECQRAIPPRETLLVPESGAVQDCFAPLYPAAADGYLAPGVAAAPGSALGVALGGKLAHPERTCIHVASPASEPYLGTALETAGRCGIGVITALLTTAPLPAAEVERLAYVETIRATRDIAPAFARGRHVADQGRPVVLRFVTTP